METCCVIPRYGIEQVGFINPNWVVPRELLSNLSSLTMESVAGDFLIL